MALPRRQKTKMLKDFLMEADLHSLSSSRDFFTSSLPRHSTMKELMTLELAPTATAATSSSPNSKTRSTSALQTMVVKVVKAIIPKTTLSKKQRNSNIGKSRSDDGVKMAVTVKDIVRWRSFRDDVAGEDSEQPGCTTTTTISTTSSSSRKSGSSWCDSDFTTAEYSPPWCGKFNEGSCDILLVQAKQGETYSPNCYAGEDYVEKRERSFSAMQMEPELKEQEEGVQEQNQEEESYDAEYKAVRLLNEVRASSNIPSSNYNINDNNVDWVLLDFFRNELREMRFRTCWLNESGSGSDRDLVKTAMSWLEGDYDSSSSYEWGGVEKNNKLGYLRDMNRERWGESKEEQDEVAEEIEGEVLSLLVHQLVEEALVA